MDENTRSGQNVGSAVSASDADSNSLTYTLEGPGADSFTIVSSSGQIRTKSPLDYETRQSYSVTVKVDDRQKRDNSVAAKSVTITVDGRSRAAACRLGLREWRGYPARLTACASPGTSPRTRGLPSPTTTCSTALVGSSGFPDGDGSPRQRGQERDHHGADGGHTLRGAGAGEK